MARAAIDCSAWSIHSVVKPGKLCANIESNRGCMPSAGRTLKTFKPGEINFSCLAISSATSSAAVPACVSPVSTTCVALLRPSLPSSVRLAASKARPLKLSVVPLVPLTLGMVRSPRSRSIEHISIRA